MRDIVYARAKKSGMSDIDAKYTADQWEKRQHPDRWKNCCSTHCERGGECRGPNDCCASLKALRAA